jgi:hypothetical protein
MSSELPNSGAAAPSPTIYLGMDVHKDSITVAVLPEGSPAPTRVDRLSADYGKLRATSIALREAGISEAVMKRVVPVTYCKEPCWSGVTSVTS